MGLFGHLIVGVVHLVLVALDIMVFFLIVRLVFRRWTVAALKALDDVGAPLIDRVLPGVGERIGWSSFNGSGGPGSLALLLVIVLGLTRMVAVSLLH